MLEDSLKKFSKYVVSQSRANLTRKDKNVKRKLYDSIKGETFVGPNSIGMYFSMEDYGVFQDKGVKGKSSSAKAPSSPYRFGSGSSSGGIGLTASIRQWVKDRRFQFRSKEEGSKGRFLSYESTAFLISRSIWHTGIKPSEFFTKPFEVAFKKLPDELIKAYGLEVDKLLKQSLN
jgi:hypothetical protein